MKIGSIEGMVDGLFQVVYDSGVLSSASTSFTVSNLEGNTAEEYMIIYKVVNNYNGVNTVYVRFNGDTGANYGRQNFFGTGTSPYAIRRTGQTIWHLLYNTTLDYTSFGVLKMTAKSGIPRLGKTIIGESMTGTTPTYVEGCSFVWNNTADEITSMTFGATGTDGIGVGSQFIIVKKVQIDATKVGDIEPQGKIDGAWELIAETNVGASGDDIINFTSLEGDTACIYRIIAYHIQYAGGSGGVFLRLNFDSSANYGRIEMKSTNAAISVLSSSGSGFMEALSWGGADSLNFCDTYIYVKSGYERLAVSQFIFNCAGEDVETVGLGAGIWSNTADEVTSITLSASASADMMAEGSHFELWRLNL